MKEWQQRNLNNAFAYDLVPSTTVCSAALRAARRVNDFPTAVRIFEGMSLPLLAIPAILEPDMVTGIGTGKGWGNEQRREEGCLA